MAADRCYMLGDSLVYVRFFHLGYEQRWNRRTKETAINMGDLDWLICQERLKGLPYIKISGEPADAMEATSNSRIPRI